MAKSPSGPRATAGLAILFALLISRSMGATSFIAVYHKGILYLGGDTLVVTDNVRSNMCKISVDGKYLVTAVGLGGVTHPDKTKDMFIDRTAAILSEHLSSQKTAEKLVQAAHEIIRQSGHPSNEDKLLIQLFWFSNDELWLNFINVHRILNDSEPEIDPAVKVPEASVIPAGRSEAYNALRVHYDLPYKPTARPKEFIRTVLDRQSKLTPEEVGRPLTIVEFSPHGKPIWDDAGRYCSNQ